jgi:hypothetical protein
MAGKWLELEGTVQPIRTIEAPLSGRPCVIYRVKLTPWQRLLEWGIGLSSQISGSPFWVTSQTRDRRRVLVDPRDADLRLPRRIHRRVCLGLDPSRDHRLARLYKQLARGKLGAIVRCSEQRLEGGDQVWLAGALEVVLDVRGLGGTYRQPPRVMLLRAVEVWGSTP